MRKRRKGERKAGKKGGIGKTSCCRLQHWRTCAVIDSGEDCV
jgi:hypothetical protein|tara:strand:+ start:87 stop:212 length:126 start_codon:yes stop_codon:yes gene_type:complete